MIEFGCPFWARAQTVLQKWGLEVFASRHGHRNANAFL